MSTSFLNKLRIMNVIFPIIFMILFVPSIKSQPLKINWQHCYGGSNFENGYKIVKGDNGFYLFCGTDSNDDDVTGFHGGHGDYWLIRTDTSGNILWEKTYGGPDEEDASDMKQTPDGGFILFGNSFSTTGEVIGNHGGSDFWLVKIDSIGNIEWSKCFGGSYNEIAYKIELTQDNGFICVGYSCSHDGDLTINYGGDDIWIVKLDYFGNILWQKSFGGTFTDWGLCVQSTSDKGVIIGGLTGSSDGNVQCNHRGFDDCWVAKLDSNGNLEWQNCYGGTGYESVVSIISTDDSGYIFTGGTNSIDGDVTGNHGDFDVWVVKLDHLGHLVWQKCYGGSRKETGLVIKKSSDGNYFIGGYTFSTDGEVSGNHSSAPEKSDMWLIKISPVGDLIWQQCFGGGWSEALNDVLELSSGKLMLLGGTETSDNSGDVHCNHHGPGTNDVWLLSVTDTTYVGMNEIKGRPIRIVVYPNPANQEVVFEYDVIQTNPANTLDIYNEFGIMVKEYPIINNNGKIAWNTQETKSGLYYYRLINQNNASAGKICIIH